MTISFQPAVVRTFPEGMRYFVALALCFVSATAGAKDPTDRTLLIRGYEGEPGSVETVFLFDTQKQCTENALMLTVKYRIKGPEKTVYFFCRAPQAS